MTKITKTVYKCDYCGFEDEREDFMNLHEDCCSLNPKNQPCATCSNHILGIGCGKRVSMDAIQGNIKCFCYDKGYPVNPFEFQQLQDMFQNISEYSNQLEDIDNNDDKE